MINKTKAIEVLVADVQYRENILRRAISQYVTDQDIPLEERWNTFTRSGQGDSRQLTSGLSVFNDFTNMVDGSNTIIETIIGHVHRRIGPISKINIKTFIGILERNIVGSRITTGSTVRVINTDIIDGVKREILERFIKEFTLPAM